MTEKFTAKPEFVAALHTQADRIGVDYRPGSGVFDPHTGERLDTPGDMVSLFHALDLPYIAPQHRNWEQVISMISRGSLAAPGSKRTIFMLTPDTPPADPQPVLDSPRRTVDFVTGQPDPTPQRRIKPL